MGRNPLTHALEVVLGLTSRALLIVTLQIERIDMGRDALMDEILGLFYPYMDGYYIHNSVFEGIEADLKNLLDDFKNSS